MERCHAFSPAGRFGHGNHYHFPPDSLMARANDALNIFGGILQFTHHIYRVLSGQIYYAGEQLVVRVKPPLFTIRALRKMTSMDLSSVKKLKCV
jgi:hypothetical protein